ncbi:heme A synthase [Mucilaginibacter robiniae]|uniref:Heme A synthase n=2 Tax=Mucilaginibacter robiniae TaxID=2728022 RepID=A0A7L5EBY0_9SPHI|nr:heme A synthase [Mucilaginibacter robiniae]
MITDQSAVRVSKKGSKAVAIWLAIGVGMIMVQILLGGITRLTGSGLSITEWKPLLGALPPLNEHAWQQSFEKYQHIAQFKKVNSSFTLADYQAIFFWEWFHREWARLLGVVFIIPFVIFIFQKRIGRDMIKPMLILFVLGGLQGAIGWIMVQSGLNDTDVRVSHIRLAIHFLCALFLLGYLLWFTLKVSVPTQQMAAQPQLKRFNLLLLVLLFFQLMYGAFMAGSHAALNAPTWPDVNGAYWPSNLSDTHDSLWYTLCYNPIAIQFIHRTLAYGIAILIVVWYFKANKVSKGLWLRQLRGVPLLLVLLQVTLGIMALLNSMYPHAIYYAVIHQFTGMLLLLSLLITLYLSSGKETVSAIVKG